MEAEKDISLEIEKFNENKRWLFNERVKLERERSELEEERKLFEVQKEIVQKQRQKLTMSQAQLDAEKMLYDKKWADLDRERLQFENEKNTFLDEQQRMKKIMEEEKRKFEILGTDADPQLFFKGIRNGADLKKRYKELTKIFHPDNDGGSIEVIRAINDEYESLKTYYIG